MVLSFTDVKEIFNPIRDLYRGVRKGKSSTGVIYTQVRNSYLNINCTSLTNTSETNDRKESLQKITEQKMKVSTPFKVLRI